MDASSGAYIVNQVEVRNLTKPFKFVNPLNNVEANTATVVSDCVYYNETNRTWFMNECRANTNVQSAEQLVCCSYFSQMLAKEGEALTSVQDPLESADEDGSSIAFILLLVSVAVIIVISALFLRYLYKKKDIDHVVHFELDTTDHTDPN